MIFFMKGLSFHLLDMSFTILVSNVNKPITDALLLVEKFSLADIAPLGVSLRVTLQVLKLFDL